MRRIMFSVLVAIILPLTLHAADEVDLLWQGNTYAPPFYQGRTLWTNESRITFYAIPHVAGANPSELIYRWKKDGIVLGSLSGVNKRSLILTDTVLSVPTEVKIDIFKKEGTSAVASATVTLTASTVRPEIVEDHPLYGLMLHKVVPSEFNLTGEEVTFSAIPFFTRASFRKAPALTYRWRTNAADNRTGNSVTYRVPEGESGSSQIFFRMSTAGVIVQPEEKSFLVQFGNQSAF